MSKRVNTVRLTRDIQRYLASKRSPLAPYAAQIVRAGQKYGVDPRLLVAIAGAETSFATNPRAGRDITTGHNACGWGPHIAFPSWEASIDTIARGLRKGYLDQGLTTVPQIGRKWAPLGAANDPNWLNTGWAGNVSAVMNQLGGGGAVGPGAVPFGPAPGSQAASPGFPASAPGFDRKGFALATLGQIAQGTYDPIRMLAQMPTYQTRSPRKRPPTGQPVSGNTAPAGTALLGGKWTMGGGMEAHQSRPLGNWQSDRAYDLMAPAGTPVYAPTGGRVLQTPLSDNSKTLWGDPRTLPLP